MVTFIPMQLRVPVAVVVAVLGGVVLFSSYTRWQNGPFYGTSFNAFRALCGLAVFWLAFHVYRHQDD